VKTSGNNVIVVGAGPGGLLLASELALAGVPCTVLERRSGRSVQSRALGLQARTLELLDLRDQAERFTELGNPLDHFRLTVGGTRIGLRRLDTTFQQLSIVPQSTTEELLEERATELGAIVRRDAEVTGVRQEPDTVRLRVRASDTGETWEESASWVVGCDGSHSVVRESLRIGFPGKTYPYNVVVGDVRLAAPPADGMLIEVGRSGLVVAIDFGNGWWRMGVVDWNPPRDPDERATPGELGSALASIFGYDLGPHDPLWMTRFRFQNRQAVTYRLGRVLLLGDAAHVHAPLGAQGLNMSMQDAMNLGWKLAAVANGDAPSVLLDSYELERRPVATRVLRATDAAIRVLMSQRPPVRSARRLVIPAVAGSERGHRLLAGYISGLSWAYPPPNGRREPSLVGRRVPDARLRDAHGNASRLFKHFHDGKFVLIDQTHNQLAAAMAPWARRANLVVARIEDRPALARYGGILVRPDGYCAWAGGPGGSPSLRTALREWCGEPDLAAV
jgi:2-polyprenyl-6-methoxyphenol hydroxylase-like FAD-dependent oxidoreductase